ncbi:efflux RND transporter periplasmic adaptor subunit [Pseudoflavitalea sp. G-6-1-2]|uniref:efflux RND transporter periplasmic adaptor subunit n=1 Tax=Pseudoflavitalea sp. G-6-1-2 TaxID=2728841 RepID=UPI00146D461F|nr:efflux RND transporter periplasmic adaptor subunit [Pseudoflavitalea sp. G-6-1-2]NML21731.1 efflux RND transporter periplasmic adaptor subunit [Pseudoflavitalea sp. G-6-1-2]
MQPLLKTNGRGLKPFLHVPSYAILSGVILTSIILSACGSSSNPGAGGGFGAPPPPELPVVAVPTAPATTYRDYQAALEGKVNVEIRPQVEGFLEKIFVDEGAYVRAGQPLFKINARVYDEVNNNAKSALAAAQANVQRAKVEVDRLQPLVNAKVISEVQLKTAQANYEAAVAAAEQAKATVGSSQINIGYTLIKAPVSGYIGRIPFKTGALVGKGEAQPLTVLSDVSEMYAYFSLSEPDFIAFKNQFAGNTIEEKVRKVPAVELLLADGSVYTQKGRLSTVDGQFNKTTGAISFRASFPNAGGTLRTGNTGRVRIPQLMNNAILVPQEATFEIQDKVFVFALGDSNKVVSKPLAITGKTANYYFVSSGVNAGEKIVFSGIGNLRDGMAIVPQAISADSLLKVKPL